MSLGPSPAAAHLPGTGRDCHNGEFHEIVWSRGLANKMQDGVRAGL